MTEQKIKKFLENSENIFADSRHFYGKLMDCSMFCKRIPVYRVFVFVFIFNKPIVAFRESVFEFCNK